MAMAPWAGSGTATTVAAAVDVRSPSINGTLEPAGALSVQNTGATNSLLISFDGGTNFLTIVAGSSFAVSQVSVASISVKSGAATTTYEWVARDREQN